MKTVILDLECTGLKADVHTLLVASFGVIEGDKLKKIKTRTILDFKGENNEKEYKLLKWTRKQFNDADVLIGHNSIAFDRNFLNGVSLREGLGYLPRKIHIDLFQTLKGRHKFSSLKLEAIADMLGVGEKDKPERKDWREGSILTPEAVERLKERCEEDVDLNFKF